MNDATTVTSLAAIGRECWLETALGDVVREFYTGGTPSTKRTDYWGGSIPWITGADIVDQKVAQPRKYLTKAGVECGATSVVPKGGILVVTRTGVGKVARAPFDVAISQDITGLVTRHDVLPEFVYWWLATHATQLVQLKQGTSITGLRREDLESLRLSLPPTGEQIGIANVLSAIQDTIEKTKAVGSTAERLRTGLLEDLLTNGVPGWHSDCRQVPGIGRVPACWDVAHLGNVADVQTGRAVGKAARGQVVGLPYLSVANVKDGHLDLKLVKTMAVSTEEITRFSLRKGDVLFTEGGDADKVGRGCVWLGEIEPCLHQNHVFAVRPGPNVLLPEFLAVYAHSWRGKSYFLSCAKQTTNLASINSTQLREFPLALPSVAEQERILSILGAVPSCEPQYRALLVLKAAISEELLSGEVRIHDARGTVQAVAR